MLSLKTIIKTVVFLKIVICFFSLLTNLAFAAIPTIGTISPSSGTIAPNLAKTFTCTYSDSDGWTDLKEAYLLISTSSTALANSVYLYYDQNTNLLYLRDDTNTTWLGGYAPGSSNIIENSQAKLNCASSTVSGLTNTLTVNFNVTFKSAYSGRRYKTYLKVVDDVGGFAGWTQKGTYEVNYSPSVGTINPSSGAGYANVAQVFTATYSDQDGWQNIRYGYFLMNISTSGSNCLYVQYNQNTNRLYLRNDANTAWLGGYAPGAANVIENSYAKLHCANTSISGSVNTLTVNWSVTLKSTFIGTKNTYLRVTDDANATAAWTQKGTWIIQSDTTAPTGTIIINNDAAFTDSLNVSLTLSAEDNIGGSGLSQMQFSNDNVTWSTPEAYATSKAWTLTSGDGTKTVYVKYNDAARNWSGAFSDTIVLDMSPPSTPVVTDEGATTVNLTQIYASWSSSDPETGIVDYEYTIGTTPGGTDVVAPISLGNITSYNKTGLNLVVGQIYYVSVRAKNGVGGWSSWGTSDGIYGKNAEPQIDDIGLTEGGRYYSDSIPLTVSVTDPDDTSFQYQYSIAASSNGRFKLRSFALSGGGGTSNAGNHIIKEGTIAEAIGSDAQVVGYKLYAGYIPVYKKILELINQTPATVVQTWTPSNTYTIDLGSGGPGRRVITVQVKDSHGAVTSKQIEIFVYRRPISPPQP